MTELNRTEVNCETGEVLVIPLTPEEIVAYEVMKKDAVDQMEQEALAKEAKDQAIISANAKLQQLGLSTEEVEALIGQKLPTAAE